MCEHCTCQTFGPIQDLHADHELMLQMIGLIRSLLKAGGDGDDITGEIGPLLSLLRTHNAKEEAGIYAMLAQNEPAYIARLTAEHGPIELLLGALAHSGEGRAFICRRPSPPERPHLYRRAGRLSLRFSDAATGAVGHGGRCPREHVVMMGSRTT